MASGIQTVHSRSGWGLPCSFSMGQEVTQVWSKGKEKKYIVTEIRQMPGGGTAAIGTDAKGKKSWLYEDCQPGGSGNCYR